MRSEGLACSYGTHSMMAASGRMSVGASDLCRATRAETGLWSALSRVHYGRRKRTLLMYEALHGRLERVRWLLARGAPRNARDHNGRTALYWASVLGHTDIVRD